MYTTQANIHVLYGYCTIAYARQAGINLKWQLLEDMSILGNGPFSFMEKIELEIAAVTSRWYRENLGRRGKSRMVYH